MPFSFEYTELRVTAGEAELLSLPDLLDIAAQSSLWLSVHLAVANDYLGFTSISFLVGSHLSIRPKVN